VSEPTWMRREITEQAATVAATVAHGLGQRDDLRALCRSRRHVLFVARGSSDNAAVYGRYLLEAYAGWQAALAAPSVATHYHAEIDLSDTVVVSVSQSGETEEIVATQAWARAHGAAIIAVTNGATSPLAIQADLVLLTLAGREHAVPATKTYTAQLAAMGVLASALASGGSLEADLGRVPDEIDRLIAASAGVEEAVDVLAAAAEIVVTGRGLVYGTALEVALKLEETCLRPVRGLSYADLRHGPIAIIDADVTAVLVCPPSGPLLAPMTELAADLRGRGATTLAVGGDADMAAACDYLLPGPDLPESVAPLGLIVPAQLVVESLARRLGLDPDAPRGLSKVTATDPEG
jgi:glutamine---fructose-6-phosphate transaminase (isomerizing)